MLPHYPLSSFNIRHKLVSNLIAAALLLALAGAPFATTRTIAAPAGVTADGSRSSDSVNASIAKVRGNLSLNLQATQLIVYAIPGGVTSGSCDTWANACELRYALSSATTGQEIWVGGHRDIPAHQRS